MQLDFRMAYIDVVLVEGDEEVDRVTVRGDADFTILTPFGSLRDIVEQELDVPRGAQFFWLGSNGQTLELDDEAPLHEGGVENGCTLFVTLRTTEEEHHRHNSETHNTSRSNAHSKSSTVLRLERILADIEPSLMEKRANELLLQWKAIKDIVV